MTSTMVSMRIENESTNFLDSSSNKEQQSGGNSEAPQGQQQAVVELDQQQAVIVEFDQAFHEEFEKGEGHIIELEENDSVSSLGSGYSVGDESSDDGDRKNRRPEQEANRRKQLRNLGSSTRFNKSRREQPKRRGRVPSRMNRSASPTANRAFTTGGLMGPPQRKQSQDLETMGKQLQRNLSTPELGTPTKKEPHNRTVSEMPAPSPRESLTDQKQSSRSLNYLEIWGTDDDETVEEDMEDEEQDGRKRRGRQYHRSQMTVDSGDSGETSRWSASTGTGNRSLNSTQMEQLSTVPRFPRRQRTGEGITKLRHRNSNDSADTSGTPKRRPQLPNRQKSFRRGGVSMNQAAQAALAKASGTPPHNTITRCVTAPESSSNPCAKESSPPSVPKRSISNDISWGRQNSMPNILSSESQHSESASSLQRSGSTPRLHVTPLRQSPRLPSRKPSGMKRESDADKADIARLLAEDTSDSENSILNDSKTPNGGGSPRMPERKPSDMQQPMNANETKDHITKLLSQDTDSDDDSILNDYKAPACRSPRIPERKPSDMQESSHAKDTKNEITKLLSQDNSDSDEDSILQDSGATLSSFQRTAQPKRSNSPINAFSSHSAKSDKDGGLDQGSKHLPNRLPRRQDSRETASETGKPNRKSPFKKRDSKKTKKKFLDESSKGGEADESCGEDGILDQSSDSEDSFGQDNSKNRLPPHLRSGAADMDGSAKMPVRQMSLNEPAKEDGEDFFAINAKYLGVDSNDEDSGEEEDLLVSNILAGKGNCQGMRRNDKML